MKKSGVSEGQSASQLISKKIAELGDWRGATLGRMRKLIREADPDVVEEWKWMGTPVWSHDGIICTGESYRSVVKLTFAKGASLKDPARLFNSSLDGNVRRAIDIHEGEKVDASAFKALIRQAIALNSSGKSKPSKKAKPEGSFAPAKVALPAPLSPGKLTKGGAGDERQKDSDDSDDYGSARRHGRLGHFRAGQVRRESAERALILRVQRIRSLAGCLHQ